MTETTVNDPDRSKQHRNAYGEAAASLEERGEPTDQVDVNVAVHVYVDATMMGWQVLMRTQGQVGAWGLEWVLTMMKAESVGRD